MASESSVVTRDEMHDFIIRCMEKVGTKREHAQALADLLVAADYRGHYSHGLNRLDMYVKDIKAKMCVSDKEPEIVKETVASALVNGNNLLGPVVGKFCIDVAIKKAKEAGIGWVSAYGSNHFGIAGWYAIRAMEQGLIGMAFTNTSPLMVPTRARKESGESSYRYEKAERRSKEKLSFRTFPALVIIVGLNTDLRHRNLRSVETNSSLPYHKSVQGGNNSSCWSSLPTGCDVAGTNPISCAAPANNGDSFVLDMATTAVALGKLEINERKGLEIPLGWGCDVNGKATKNPSEATGLMPLGGTEECSGYKGYGLSMMVEVFCGILAGAQFGSNIRKWKTTDRIADLGQCFVAIDPNAFAPGFTDRISELNATLRNQEPAAGEEEVLVPGDPERKHMDKCNALGGIPYHTNQITYANNLASELGIQPLKTLN